MGIRIIENEAAKLKAGEYHDRLCEHCEQTKPAREVRTLGFIAREDRGNYILCFDCFGPRIKWEETGTKNKRLWESPARMS